MPARSRGPVPSERLVDGGRRGRLSLIGVGLVTLMSTLAIVATYTELSHTWDEGIHLAAGLELLQDGRYALQTENPPVARVALAVIPYLSGARLPPPDRRPSGFAADLFYRTPRYVRHVTEARLANLLFFWAAVGLTWLLAGGRADPRVAFLAAASVATLAPIVAHAGLATTDVGFLASFLLTMLALRRALARPTLRSMLLLGAATGVAIATKFSTLVFLPPAAAAVVACRYWDRRRGWARALAGPRLWRALVTVAIAAVLVTWGCYGFRVGRLADLPTRISYGEVPASGWPGRIRSWPIPGHEIVHGLLFVKAHAAAGHRATLLGEYSQRGFWLFYPVVLLTKAPMPFLLFTGIGLWGLCTGPAGPERRWFAGLGLAALGVLLAALASPINLGVRHVLVIYPLVGLAAAYGLARRAETSRRGSWLITAGVGCIALQLGLLALAVPNQLTYFNLLAGSSPAYVSSDSDFDWGQDMLALERYFASHRVPELHVQLSGTTRACLHGLPPLRALPIHPVTGWIAVSERIYQLNRGPIRRDPCGPPGGANRIMADPGWLDWLKPYRPVAIVGRTVRLYHIAPPEPEMQQK